MLGNLRRSLTRESANILYCSLIRPILEYCVNVWGCCGEGHKHGLEVIQNRAARIVARTVRSNPAMDVLNRPTLEERRRKTVFKLVKNTCKVNVPNILNNILNVIIQFTPAPLDRATFYIRLLWEQRSQNDLSITMGALFLTNYLDGISYLFTSNFFICT